MQLNWVGMRPTFRAKGITNLKSAKCLKHENIKTFPAGVVGHEISNSTLLFIWCTELALEGP